MEGPCRNPSSTAPTSQLLSALPKPQGSFPSPFMTTAAPSPRVPCTSPLLLPYTEGIHGRMGKKRVFLRDKMRQMIATFFSNFIGFIGEQGHGSQGKIMRGLCLRISLVRNVIFQFLSGRLSFSLSLQLSHRQRRQSPPSCGDEAMMVSLHISWMEKEQAGGTALLTKEVLGFSGGPIRPLEG